MERLPALEALDRIEGMVPSIESRGVSVGIFPENTSRELVADLKLADLIVCLALQDPEFKQVMERRHQVPTEIFPTSSDAVEQITVMGSPTVVSVVEDLVGTDGAIRILSAGKTAAGLRANLNGFAGDAKEILDLLILGLEIKKIDGSGQIGQTSVDNDLDPGVNIGGEQSESAKKCKTRKDPAKEARKQQGREAAAARNGRHQMNASIHTDHLGKRF